MKIEKYKKLKNGKYELIMEYDQTIELYEDTILKFNLLLTKNIKKNLTEILKFDKRLDTYYSALKYLKVKPRSKKEVTDYLLAKEYRKNDIENALKKLEQQGYLNDLLYAKSILNHKLITTSNGPLKIKNDLLKKGIDVNIVQQILEEYNEDTQLEKIRKIVNRMIKSNRNKSIQMLQRKIITDLISQGFSKKEINTVMDESTFLEDKEIENREYEKLYKKLSRKYSGEELKIKIRQKMLQKGFRTESDTL
ncbi:MAG: hypothetical protein HFJ12_04360 [Bacilli bacterium]|nr:hypothetical protein [Bacilli bacterium]